MRIIAGRNRGTRLLTPTNTNTRPTSDRARENLFNILAHGQWSSHIQGGRVADFFAGTGAVGLEALSRGARYCWFIESNRTILSILKSNVQKCHRQDQCVIKAVSVLALPIAPPEITGEGVDMLFLDPPYHQNLGVSALEIALKRGWLGQNSLAILQCHPAENISLPAPLALWEDRRYGANRFLFARPIF